MSQIDIFCGRTDSKTGKRLVIASNGDEIFRDHINTDEAWLRKAFVKEVKNRADPSFSEMLASYDDNDSGGSKTIDAAALDKLIVERAEQRDQEQLDAVNADSFEPVLVNMANVKPKPVRWLWPGRIAIGKVTILAGDPGLGKSFVTCDITARVTQGACWPDDPRYAPPQGGVLMLNAEDDLEDTIRPRLDAAGADVARVQVLVGVKEAGDPKGRPRLTDLSCDIERMKVAIQRTPDCKLVVIDPISAYLGRGVNSHKNAEVRGMIMAPLSEMACHHGVAVLAIDHLNKSDARAIYRTSGSLGFVAAARAAWVVTADKADPSRRLLLPIKNNLAADVQGLAYRIGGKGPRVEWEAGAVNVSADDALSTSDDGDDATKEEAKAWLQSKLDDGPLPSKQVQDAAKADGISVRNLAFAKKALKVTAKQQGFHGGWAWMLPAHSNAVSQ